MTSGEIAALAGEGEPEFDEDEVSQAILAARGNLTTVAERLRVSSARLRLYVDARPALRAAMQETIERGVDQAVEILFEGLADLTSYQNRFYAAKELLRTDAARRRGFGQERGVAATLEVKAGDARPTTIALKWLEPGDASAEGKMIEGEAS